jgi:putative phosphoesterase
LSFRAHAPTGARPDRLKFATIRRMRIAALYDIHGNLPALDAVLAEVDMLDVDAIVIGGDIVPGPMPVETIDRVRALGERARFVMGNADREVVAMVDAGTGVEDVAEDWMRMSAWGAGLLDGERRDFLAAFAPTARLEAGDLGPVLFCHGSPRSDTEIITALTPPERLEPMHAGVAEPIVVCGHTHNQFTLEHDGRRVVNAGSVGLPYQGAAAAFWLLLGPDIDLRRTDYDVEAALDAMRATGAPGVDEQLHQSLVDPADATMVARMFEDRAAAAEA